MKSGMFSPILMPQTYKMLWDSWMKSTKSFLFCFHGGPLLRREKRLVLVATAMERSIPIYYWVDECVFFRYPGKSFWHDELSSLWFQSFEDVLEVVVPQSGWMHYWIPARCPHPTEQGILQNPSGGKTGHRGLFERLGWWQKGTDQIFMEYRPTGHRKQFANIEEMSGKREVTWSIQLQKHLWKIT